MVAAVSVRADGKAEMAWVGETPWHGLGSELQKGASIEVWREAAGMDWAIQGSPVRYHEGERVFEMPNQQVLYRSDTKMPLSVVSNAYKVVQPGEVLEFFSDLTEANGFSLETAGTLFDGRRFWALASINEQACVVGDDQIGGYLLLSTSCDGSLPTNARFTTVRVVCNNTLSMALKKSDKRSINVTHRSKFNANKVKDDLGIARDSFGTFMKATRQLAAKTITTKKAEAFVETLLSDMKFVTKKDVTKSSQFNKIMDLFNGGALGGQLVGVEGTAWGLVNAVTEFVDHRTNTRSANARLANAWFGRGDDLKTEALERALALV